MKAMILAAGLGTRLGALGRRCPKCLLKFGDTTLLAHNIKRLKQAGVSTLVINLHHLGQGIEHYLHANGNFGLEIHCCYEKDLLESGGSVKNARQFFNDTDDFFLHNGDIYSEMDLSHLMTHHQHSGALATLAVQQRKSTRFLIFDSNRQLVGWRDVIRKVSMGLVEENEAAKTCTAFAFSGVQVVSGQIFAFMSSTEEKFSIISTYLAAVAQGAKVIAYCEPDPQWLDVGTPERLAKLRARFVSS